MGIKLTLGKCGHFVFKAEETYLIEVVMRES